MNYEQSPQSPHEEHRLDVDAQIVFKDRQPIAVEFRYLEDDGSVSEHTVAVGVDFDSNAVYGGLMSWLGRYNETPQGAELIAVKIGDDWYEL